MDGQFYCKLYKDPDNNGEDYKCQTDWGVFTGNSYSNAIAKAAADAQQTLGGGAGIWTPIISPP